MRLLEENIGINLLDLSLDNNFLNMKFEHKKYNLRSTSN